MGLSWGKSNKLSGIENVQKIQRWLCLVAAAFCAATPALAADPAVNPDATLVFYNLAGNQTLDPADPQNNSSFAHDSLLAIYETLIRLDDAGNPGRGLDSLPRSDRHRADPAQRRNIPRWHAGHGRRGRPKFRAQLRPRQSRWQFDPGSHGLDRRDRGDRRPHDPAQAENPQRTNRILARRHRRDDYGALGLCQWPVEAGRCGSVPGSRFRCQY